MTEYVPHTHASFRVRKVHPLILYVAARLGLWRLVVVTKDNLPHDPECTAEYAVLREEARS